MTFVRPTLSDLVARIAGDINARLPGADSQLRRSVLDVLGRAQAGSAHGLYGYLDWAARQILPDTADADQLDRHAAIWGVTRKAASVATGSLSLAGVNGSIVPAGSIAQRADGTRYRTITASGIVDGVGEVGIEAIDTGTGGNASAGASLTFVSPISGLQSIASSVLGVTGGAAEEEDAAIRARLLARIRTPPKGGAATDWTAWALEMPGVTRAWVYPGWMGPGTVGLTFVLDGRGDILPTPADIAAMDAYIGQRRPVCATQVIFAPTPVPVDLLIIATPVSAVVRAAIVAELDDLFAREAQPGGTIHLSRINEAISLAAGEYDHRTLSPASDVAAPPGALPVLGNVAWA